MLKGRVLASLIVAACAVVVSATVAGAAIDDTVKPYAIGLAGYETKRLLSAGDTVPETSNPNLQYQMVGIPDGLGAHENPNGTRTIFMNHELSPFVFPQPPAGQTPSPSSEPLVGRPLTRGALVSKLIVDENGNVLSGDRAYDFMFNENVPHGPAPDESNTTRAFSRFCSGDLAGPEQHGFDRWIYLTNEEDQDPINTFDGKGGLAVAIFDNELHTLPRLGRFAWENSVTQPKEGQRTVIMSMEDGPATLTKTSENSQVYMYVGTKERGPGETVLGRNGLDNGNLYVLARAGANGDAIDASEADFEGTIDVTWVNLGNVSDLDEAALEAATDAAKGIRFARPEDGAFNDKNTNEFFFVTTGSNGPATDPNKLGRVYSLELDRNDPTRPGKLAVVINADQVIAAGGDTAISPDNVDISRNYLMINEDGTGAPGGSRGVMAAKGRDGSIWRFETNASFPGINPNGTRVAELDPPGRSGLETVGAGIWETSGIIDTSSLFGRGTWLFDVQAHPPTAAPPANTIEDGQLLLLIPRGDDDDDD
jgi:Bacterial protein of unknown function (DUF839)